MLLFTICIFIARRKIVQKKRKRKQYKSNKLKIIAPTWNDKLELLDGFYSVSYIQDYIEYIIKKHESSKINPPIHVYINIINSRLVFRKDRYKLGLQTPEIMKSFVCRKKTDKQKKKWRKSTTS